MQRPMFYLGGNTKLVLFNLLFFIFSSKANATLCTEVSAFLSSIRSAPFLSKEKYPTAHQFIDGLEAAVGLPVDEIVEHGWTPDFEKKLLQKVEEFRFDQADHLALTMHAQVFTSAAVGEPHRALIVQLYDGRELVGVLAKRVTWDPLRRHLQGYLSTVYFQDTFYRPSGIAGYLQRFFDKVLYQPLGVKNEFLRANYVGRYVWAKEGFRFIDLVRWSQIKDPKLTLSYSEMMRINFRRFLAAHRIAVTDLNIPSLEVLTEPTDLIDVRHRDGLKLWIQPMLGSNYLGHPVEMTIGKAFMMSDDAPEDRESIQMVGGLGRMVFSGRSMPPWHGVRDIP